LILIFISCSTECRPAVIVFLFRVRVLRQTRAKTKSGGLCHEVYATVKELVTGRIDTICASRTRVTEVYRCRDTPLEIRTLPGSGLRTRYFLLKYQGIPDFTEMY